MHPIIANRRILLAALVGTSVEFYDFYIYATAAALVLGPLFFPSSSDTAQLLSAYASFGLAFVARPVGAAVFGHFGDRIGRKSTLVASLMLMGASTLLIAFLPTYQQIGWWAPLLLCVLRFGQGFGLGGEWGGAALLAVENAPEGWRGRFGTAPQMGAPIGFIAANGLFLILGVTLTPDQFRDWGWRLPFLASAILVGLGLWVRLKVSETPAFKRVLAEGPPPSVPLGEMAREHFGAVVRGTLAVVACFAIFYIATAFALGYGTTKLGHPKQAFLGVQLIAILFMAAGIAIAGWWSDRSSPRKVLMWGCAGTVAAGIALAPLMAGPLALAGLFLALALFVMGFVYGPVGAWLPDQFPARVRYTGASIAFNVGGVIGGALTPFAAQALSAKGLGWVGLYLAAAGVLSWIGLAASRRR
ncbi:MFS transporter [Sphingomonas pruni]|uniref:MFS transporter n=1 Tax=Sphingomonas pruni TaxID=40683 RepID=UPI0008377CA9|nr:MFS transporter [Sphingomonas pruni]